MNGRKEVTVLPSMWDKFAWAPVALYTLAIAVLSQFDSRIVHENQFLLAFFNLLFCSTAAFLFAYLSAAYFKVQSDISLLWLSSGMLAWGFSSAMLGPMHNDINMQLSVYDTGLCLSAFLCLCGAITASSRSPEKPRNSFSSNIVLTMFYAGTAGFMALLAWTAGKHLLPTFYSAGHGSTLLRRIVLGAVVTQFGIASGILYSLNGKHKNPFLHWFSLGIMLLAIGILGFWLTIPGTALCWTARSAQYLAGLYLLAAIVPLWRGELGWKPAFLESQDRYRTLVEMSPDAIFVNRPDAIIYVNDAAVKLFRAASASQLIGHSPFELFPSDYHPLLRERIKEVLAGHPVPIIEKKALRMDGSTFDVEIRASFLLERGKPAIQVLYRDITERKRIEDALRESEDRFKAIAESTPIGIGVVGIPNGEFLYVNSAALKTFGYSELDLSLLSSPDIYYDQADRAHILQSMSEDNAVDNYELMLKKKDRTPFWALASVRLIKFGGRFAFLSSFLDITNRKLAEAALRRRAEELSIANQNLEAFAFSVSHDLRNPLQSILACTEVLKRVASPEDERKALDHITRSTDRMSQVIAGLMTLANISNRELSIKKYNLSCTALSVIEEIKLQDPKRCVTWAIEPDLMVNADEGLLWILLHNLFDNAWKFTSKREDARVEIGRLSEETSPVYFVRDNGTGFDMAAVEKLFIPFQRLHSEKDYPGTGLGLTIVKRIVEKHGGRVWVKAEKDKGATFFFTLGP